MRSVGLLPVVGAMLVLAGFGPVLPAAAAPGAPGAAPAAPRAIPAYPVPAGCSPVSLAQAQSGSTACVHDLLVTDTLNPGEQNRSLFTATDGQLSLGPRCPRGGPRADPWRGWS